jgi:low affinity Fe/Cu permease
MRAIIPEADMDWIKRRLTDLGTLAAHPSAFLIVAAYTLGWLAFERETFDWHGVATLCTWTMTLFIQRAEHRDTQAIHAKLDELLRTDPRAETDVARMDEREPEDIEKYRHKTKER